MIELITLDIAAPFSTSHFIKYGSTNYLKLYCYVRFTVTYKHIHPISKKMYSQILLVNSCV